MVFQKWGFSIEPCRLICALTCLCIKVRRWRLFGKSLVQKRLTLASVLPVNPSPILQNRARPIPCQSLCISCNILSLLLRWHSLPWYLGYCLCIPLDWSGTSRSLFTKIGVVSGCLCFGRNASQWRPSLNSSVPHRGNMWRFSHPFHRTTSKA